MITTIQINSSEIRFFGTKLHKNKLPNKACLVVLVHLNNNSEVERTTTNSKGYFEFKFNPSDIVSGNYQVQFHGSTYKAKNIPEGDWETFAFTNPFDGAALEPIEFNIRPTLVVSEGDWTYDNNNNNIVDVIFNISNAVVTKNGVPNCATARGRVAQLGIYERVASTGEYKFLMMYALDGSVGNVNTYSSSSNNITTDEEAITFTIKKTLPSKPTPGAPIYMDYYVIFFNPISLIAQYQDNNRYNELGDIRVYDTDVEFNGVPDVLEAGHVLPIVSAGTAAVSELVRMEAGSLKSYAQIMLNGVKVDQGTITNVLIESKLGNIGASCSLQFKKNIYSPAFYYNPTIGGEGILGGYNIAHMNDDSNVDKPNWGDPNAPTPNWKPFIIRFKIKENDKFKTFDYVFVDNLFHIAFLDSDKYSKCSVRIGQTKEETVLNFIQAIKNISSFEFIYPSKDILDNMLKDPQNLNNVCWKWMNVDAYNNFVFINHYENSIDEYYDIEFLNSSAIKFTRKNPAADNNYGNDDIITTVFKQDETLEQIEIINSASNFNFNFIGGEESIDSKWGILTTVPVLWSKGSNSLDKNFITDNIISAYGKNTFNKFKFTFLDNFGYHGKNNNQDFTIELEHNFDLIPDSVSVFDEFYFVPNLRFLNTQTVSIITDVVSEGNVTTSTILDKQGGSFGDNILVWDDVNNSTKNINARKAILNSEPVNIPIANLQQPLEYHVFVYLSPKSDDLVYTPTGNFPSEASRRSYWGMDMIGATNYIYKIKPYVDVEQPKYWVYLGSTRQCSYKISLPLNLNSYYWVGFGDLNTKLYSSILHRSSWDFDEVKEAITPIPIKNIPNIPIISTNNTKEEIAGVN